MSRSFEISLEIAAPTEAVWRALTDAKELVRWFPLEAEIEPRVGGRYFVSWRNAWQGEGRIEICEPNRHLRTTWPSTLADPARPVSLAVDYHLEGRGGKTVLRLVHSGFGDAPAWDEEYDGISVGWTFELRSLRHYLERHAGSDRNVAYVVSPRGRDRETVWNRVWRDGFRANPPSGLSEGERYGLALAGRRFSGTVLDCRGPRQFAGTVAELGNALFRVEIFGGHASLWLSAWQAEAAEVARIESEWMEMVARLFPEPVRR